MATYLLDTNILSDLIKNPQGKVAKKISQAGEEHVCTSIIVASELRYGVEKSGSQVLRKRIDELLRVLSILPFSEPADIRYGKIRSDLHAKGKPIGPNDMLIAAHALANDLVLATANEKEFSRVEGLQIENWLS